VIIFDEPTSVLAPQEVESFLDLLRRLRADGYGVLLITHKIREVLACADHVTVLRAGEVVWSAGREAGWDEAALVRAMIGDKALQQVGRRKEPHGEKSPAEPEPLITIADGVIRGDHGETVLGEVRLDVRAGEILGVAGISGSGQRELAEALFGLRPLAEGELRVAGRPMPADPRAFIAAGVTYVSEDPLRDSVIPGFTILEHMVLDGLPMKPKGAGIDWRGVREALGASEEAAVLALADPARRADTLSGGNVQRMVLARALLRKPKALVISYPSRGLDIGTTRVIQQRLIELAESGTAVVLFSEDLDELLTLSDRIVVLSGRRLHGPYRTEETDAAAIGSRMLKGESA
jgi:simple sugar transport system ATP-binding protein